MKHKDHFHGSDLEKIEMRYGIAKDQIISFSANVNPLGISPKLKTTLVDRINAIMTYPDREYTTLRRSISKYVQANMEHIIVGNGATELISLMMQMIKPKKALILGPSYSEYEREISLVGGVTLYHQLLEKNNYQLDLSAFISDLSEDINLLVLCNPNNPTSTAIDCQHMKLILDHCKELNIFVLVDETYVEFAEDLTNITAVSLVQEYQNIMILRGISKFFAAPGLRLGYAICSNEDLLGEIDLKKNPWSINSLAAIAGEIMFSDEEYIKETRELIARERIRIFERLSGCTNIKVYPPTANFILVQILSPEITSMDLFEAAIKHGLMIRDCSSFPFLGDRFIRFCFMSPEMNNLLIDTLLEVLER